MIGNEIDILFNSEIGTSQSEMNNDLIIFIITGVTISAIIMFILHANEEIFPGDIVLHASQLEYPTRNSENTLNSFVKNEFI